MIGEPATLNRRYTRGFQYGIAYTYSKSFDYANDDTSDLSFPRPYKAFNYAASDFDQTHIFTLNYIYDFPSLCRRVHDNTLVKAVFDNWQLSGTTSYATGRPKNNLAATYTSGTTDYTGGQVSARPNMTCDPIKGISGSAPNGTPYVINVKCFARPTAIGQIGNMPRNAVRIPSTFNTDLAFFKNVPFGENRAVQLRWEMYNLFNRANFNDIDGNMTFDAAGVQTNTNFGTPTTARFPRVMQGSIRITFERAFDLRIVLEHDSPAC